MSTRRRWLVGGIVALVAVAGATGAWWWLRRDDRANPPPSTTTSSTAPVPTAFAPLTGLPVDQVDMRPVLGVKIDMAPEVTRFAGLERADMVDELLVEGGITRGLALFQSQDAASVGPVRSLRTSDFDLVANLNNPILAFSGADELTLRASRSAPFVPYTPDSPGADQVFRRDRSIRAPHNLFLSTDGVRRNVTDAGTAVAPFDMARPTDPAPAGLPVPGVQVRFSTSTTVAFTWDSGRREWLRWARGGKQADVDGTQLGTANVVVLDMVYGHPPWDRNSPELVSVGSGTGRLLSGGSVTPVTWVRPTARAPFTLTGADGVEVRIPSGRTWVAFPPEGVTAIMDEPAVKALLGG
jgi:hypothetical protein